MRNLLFILLFPTFAFAKVCIPIGTSFEEIVKSKDFISSESGIILNKLVKSTDAMFKYRYDNCDATPQMVKDNCRSSCILTKEKNYQGTCRRFCEIQRLVLQSRELGICEQKLKDIVKIEQDMRKGHDKSQPFEDRANK